VGLKKGLKRIGREEAEENIPSDPVGQGGMEGEKSREAPIVQSDETGRNESEKGGEAKVITRARSIEPVLNTSGRVQKASPKGEENPRMRALF